MTSILKNERPMSISGVVKTTTITKRQGIFTLVKIYFIQELVHYIRIQNGAQLLYCNNF